ncbi:MAG: xylulokinase [Oscillospiraceae bacterium]|nr:xylulokinase [Oscillospiraceae bacterium]
MSKYILAHDLGTSGNKATLYDFSGRLKAFSNYAYETFYPAPNCVEQRPSLWWDSVCGSTKALLKDSGVSPSEIACVTFSGQMMGCVLVGGNGEILRDAIIWADSRAVKQEAFIKSQIGPREFYYITGHRPTAFYSLAKLLWVKDNEPELYAKAAKLLNAKDYIIYRLTGEFVTDYSDASGTNLFDLRKKEWSRDIIDAVGISEELLPRAVSSLETVGGVGSEAARLTGLLEGTPVIAGGGDGSCAAVGAGAVEEGSAYIVIGSSSWISNVSRSPVFDPDMQTFNWVALDPGFYAPCGTMQAAGYSLSWLKNTLCEIDAVEAKDRGIGVYEVIDRKIAQSAPGAGNLIFLPYLLGERSPRWNADAKGAFIGLTMTSTKNDMMRAVMEGVGYNLKIILDIISRENPAEKITAIGGGAKSGVWVQILADIWQKPIEVLEYTEEATSMGAAICAGKAIGAFSGFDQIYSCNRPVKLVKPRAENAVTYSKLYGLFGKLYNALEGSFGEF